MIIQLRGTVVDAVECVGSAWKPEKKIDAASNYIFDYDVAGVLFARVEDFVKTSSTKGGNIQTC